MSRAVPVPIGYFGKIPGRGDFVKSSDSPVLTTLLDGWLAQAMERLTADARWKLTYDALAPIHFAFIGPRRGRAVAGHLVASSDQSGRRFPFLMMGALDVDRPDAFVANSPLALARLWTRLEALGAGVLAAPEPGAALQAAAASTVELDLSAGAHDAAYSQFLEQHSVGALQAMLAQAGFAGDLRRLLLALGLLLQPVLATSSSRLEKSLVLPLPLDPAARNLAGAFWMHLITPFLARADFELSLFITRLGERPALVLGFSGASAHTLHAIMDPLAGAEHHIAFDDLDWVEEQIGADYALKKVSTYLAQPALSLKSACESVHAAFIGT